MFGLLTIRPFISILTFWWPLLLSVKALQVPGQNIQFLLTYWLFYTCLCQIQNIILELPIPISTFLILIGDFSQIWMFYSHGCLVALYYYIPDISGGYTLSELVDMLDQQFLDPIVNLFWVKNTVFQSFLQPLSSKFLPLDEFLAFNKDLCEQQSLPGKRLSFLQYSLDYFCYVDLDQELRARYLKTRLFVSKIRDIIANIKLSVTQKTKTYRTKDFSNSVEPRVSSGVSVVSPHSRRTSGLSSRNISPKEHHSKVQELIDLAEPIKLEYSQHRLSQTVQRTCYEKVPRTLLLPKRFYLDNHEENSASRWHRGGQINVKKRTRSQSGRGDLIDPPYPVRVNERV